MKIGGKKIRPMANPVPLPKALASLTLYIMLIMASMILISTMIMEIIKLSFVSRVPCQQEDTIPRTNVSQKYAGCHAIL